MVRAEIERNKKFENQIEYFIAKANLERIDELLRESLHKKLIGLQNVFHFEYDANTVPKTFDTKHANDNSLFSDGDVIRQMEERKLADTWRYKVRTLKKAEVLDSDASSELSNESLAWKPPKIIVGPKSKHTKAPPLIQICEPIKVKDNYKFLFPREFILKEKQRILPKITQNTADFFRLQVEHQSYFKSLYLLREHYKQSDLLMQSLREAIRQYPQVHNKPNTNRQLKRIKKNLVAQVEDIATEFKELYTIVGIHDITSAKLPNSDEYYERKYGFIDEAETKNLITTLLKENKELKIQIQQKYQKKTFQKGEDCGT